MILFNIYQQFFNAFKAAHPSLKGIEIQEKVNSKWPSLKKEIKKGNLMNFNDQLNALKLKAAKAT